MNLTERLVTRTEIDKEKIKILGVLVRRMFDVKGNPKGNWKNMTWLALGNSIIATLNDVMENDIDSLLEDFSADEKESLLERGETFNYPFPNPKTDKEGEANGDAWDKRKKELIDKYKIADSI